MLRVLHLIATREFSDSCCQIDEEEYSMTSPDDTIIGSRWKIHEHFRSRSRLLSKGESSSVWRHRWYGTL